MGQAAQVDRVAGQRDLGHLGVDHGVALIGLFGAEYVAAARGQVAQHRTDEFVRHPHGDQIHRLEQVDPGGRGRLPQGQPAGHLDPNETLTEAAVRETLEETGWDVEATGIVGIYLYTAPSNGVTYQRVCFIAKALKHHPDYQLDDGILRARWLTRDELMAVRDDWRSELIIRCIDDYLASQRHSLELIRPSL